MSGTRRFVAEQDYYAVLGVEPIATHAQVEEGFRKRGNMRLPDNATPDVRQAEAQRLALVNKAYEILSSPAHRFHYDVRRFRGRTPENPKVETLFLAGCRLFRQHDSQGAIRALKRAVDLHPHVPLYRTHLAIAYSEVNWPTLAREELKMALRIDPDNEFAQETLARLFFRVRDRRILVINSTWIGQVAAVLFASLVIGIVWQTGITQKATNQALAKVQQVKEELVPEKKVTHDQSTIPEELAEPKPSPVADGGAAVKRLPDDTAASDSQLDYSDKQITRKTFYADQGMVVVSFKDGNLVTYRPAELEGWKLNAKGQPVVVTRSGEVIPTPADVPLSAPDGSQLDPAPYAHLFPEYGTSVVAASDTAPSTEAPAGTQVGGI